MIRLASTLTDWSTVVGKFILTDGPYEWSIVGSVRFVVRVASNGRCLYVVRPNRLGEAESSRPETPMMTEGVIVVCDTYQEVLDCLVLNSEAYSLHQGLQKKQVENTQMLRDRLRKMCAT